MAKISLVSAKYIIHASIEIKGAVDKPDVIGAIFGQTEGLLGSDLELRELQRSGRIGRIEVKVDTQGGITRGDIIIPSSLDKAETSIVGASLEIIQRIGPCESRIKVEKIEDVRISKRGFVLDRAKTLLKHLTEEVLPESHELADEVAASVRALEIQEYGSDRLPAGPGIAESEEIFIVEGRADVLNLLKHGIKNAIAINGTSVPQTIKDLSRKKVITALVDGDRGGELIIKELASTCDLDFWAKAPDGKEVEELTKKEVITLLRMKKSAEKVVSKEIKELKEAKKMQREEQEVPAAVLKSPISSKTPLKPVKKVRREQITTEDKGIFREYLEDLIGTRAAVVLDEDLEVIGKVPIAELPSTIKNVESVFAVIFDGDIDQTILEVAEKAGVFVIVGMDKKVKTASKVNLLTVDDL